jgi:hypothetical protein
MAPMCGKWVQANANNPGWGNAGEVESLLDMMILNFQAENCETFNPEKTLEISHLPESLEKYL